VVALPGVPGGVLGEVETPEEERTLGEFPQVPGATAQLPAEDLRVGAGGGDVLPGDDLLVRPGEQRGERGAAGLVMGAFGAERGGGAGAGGVRDTEDTEDAEDAEDTEEPEAAEGTAGTGGGTAEGMGPAYLISVTR
jgi:hypothetical protein